MITNVKITKTALGYEDHGIFTCLLYVEGDSIYSTYGGYALDDYNGKTRAATVEGFQAIIDLMRVFEVRKWEDFTGMYIRCEIEHQTITKIGHLIKDKWFSFKDFFATQKPTPEEIKETNCKTK